MFTPETPIFQQLAAQIADDIVSGVYKEGAPVPSANEYSVFFQVNPATVSKSINLLLDLGALYRKRGIGMFVAEGARELLIAKRRFEFDKDFIEPLLREARLIGIEKENLIERIGMGDERD